MDSNEMKRARGGMGGLFGNGLHGGLATNLCPGSQVLRAKPVADGLQGTRPGVAMQPIRSGREWVKRTEFSGARPATRQAKTWNSGRAGFFHLPIENASGLIIPPTW